MSDEMQTGMHPMTVAELCLLWSVPHPAYGDVASTGSTTLRFRGGERLPETVAKVLGKFMPYLQRYAARNYPNYPDDTAEAYAEFVLLIIRKPFVFNTRYERTLRSFIFQCYRNKLHDVLKRKNRWCERKRRAGEFILTTCRVRESDEKRAARRCVRIANEEFVSGNDADTALLHGVTESDRSTWIAHTVDGLTEAEIGARINRTETAVSARLGKVRGYLRDRTVELLNK